MSSAQQKVQQHPAFQQAQAKANYYLAQLDKELSRYPVLVNMEQRTQVPKAYAFIGAVTLLTLLHFVNALAAPASNLIGWGLPAYLSFKALESPGHDDDAQWLTYWIIFGFFNFAEGFALRALLYYFPWYFSFKTLFILWLQLPAFRGAQTAYYSVLKPVLVNLSHRANSGRTFSNDTVTAEGLRDRVATATSE
ncbi:TB2/DP1, HVA22 family-domain-containing protein [Lactarius hatsudake]|nr:TB2/DP1, HVA22 family-domain-containing protein [Lactarius hatsudake]